MAVLNGSSFVSKWIARFADNVSREITEGDLREFVQDINESFINNVDFTAPSATFSSITGSATDNPSLVENFNNIINSIRGGVAVEYNTLQKLLTYINTQLALKQDKGINGGTP